MHILIIGASKGIGLETARQAVAAGYQVRGFARSAAGIDLSHPNFEKFPGDALNVSDVAVALVGVDVVIQTLGVGFGELFRPVYLFSQASELLVAAMQAGGVERLIAVTGFGAGDSGARISAFQRLPFQLMFGRAYADKSLQERLIMQSGLDWTIARPGVLTAGAKTGRYKVLTEPSQWRNGMIARANVADFLVRQLEGRDYIHKAPVLIN